MLAGGASLLPAATSGCVHCEIKVPCLAWLRLGESYDIAVVQHLDASFFASLPFPFGPVGPKPRSCGSGFDLNVDDHLRMTAEARVDPPSGDGCANCYYVKARPEIAGVTFGPEQPGNGGLGEPHFIAGLQATLREGCAGKYEVGLVPVEGDYRRSGRNDVQTDYVLFRVFATGTPEPCVVEGSEIIEGGGGCWDAWTVRIRDESGDLISMDLPVAPADTSKGDAGP